jgi:Protein of unknown function (DUF5132)
MEEFAFYVTLVKYIGSEIPMAKHSQTSHPETEQHEEIHGEAESVASNGDHFGEVKSDDIVAKAATIAVVGVGVALISTELIPGMLIGVAAAMLPGLGPKMRPLLKSTVRAGFSAVRKTREMLSEASEQVQDMLAEASAEDTPPVPTPPTPTRGSRRHA